MEYVVATSFDYTHFEESNGPFITISFETSPYVLDRNMNQLRLKNSINQLKEILPNSTLINELTELNEDPNFWDQVKQGLVLICYDKENVVHFLDEKVEEKVVVDKYPYLIDLIRYYQQLQEVDVLLLNKEVFHLYYGNFNHLTKITLSDDIPIKVSDVLGTELGERYFSNSSSGRLQGDEGKKAAEETDLVRYFNYVDKVVFEHLSKKSKRPLVLVALPEYHSLFREVSQNQYLFKDGIKMDFSRFSKETLESQLKSLFMPHFQEFLTEWKDKFYTLQASGKASDFVDDIVLALFEGRVDTLFVQHSKPLQGHINLDEQSYEINPLVENDVRNHLVILALRSKARVIILNDNEMKKTLNLACILRY